MKILLYFFILIFNSKLLSEDYKVILSFDTEVLAVTNEQGNLIPNCIDLLILNKSKDACIEKPYSGGWQSVNNVNRIRIWFKLIIFC